MADTPPTVFMAYDVPVSTFNGASLFEDFEEEVGVLLRSRPGLNDQQKKDLIFRHLGRDARRELACQPAQCTAEGLLYCAHCGKSTETAGLSPSWTWSSTPADREHMKQYATSAIDCTSYTEPLKMANNGMEPALTSYLGTNLLQD
ncbi:hypothetical protein ElyMa_005922400 [Elysia marginata]|uniref:Uncharacterized protein n=1 Tax=Elysia marginata TaxID=1093978 RepID=A0AAV4G794_9GAST|nr:hypothetical protein ElyMa_005922400 [Elysia marginata]